MSGTVTSTEGIRSTMVTTEVSATSRSFVKDGTQNGITESKVPQELGTLPTSRLSAQDGEGQMEGDTTRNQGKGLSALHACCEGDTEASRQLEELKRLSEAQCTLDYLEIKPVAGATGNPQSVSDMDKIRHRGWSRWRIFVIILVAFLLTRYRRSLISVISKSLH